MMTRLFLRQFILFIGLLWIASPFLNAQSPQDTLQYSRVKIYFDDRSIQDLSRLGVAVDHGRVKKGVFLISDYSERAIHKIDTAGFRYEILIEDVKEFYRERNEQETDTLSKEEERHKKKARPVRTDACGYPNNYPTPAGFSLGSMGGYFTRAEMLEHLDTMAARFPNLITARQPISSDTTHNGHNIHYVKISDNPSVDENEPEVLYTALHHAREPASLSQMIFYMYYLLENYSTDPSIQYLVDSTEMYFIPCVNPDGYLYNESTDPNGGGMWRKNRRDNGDGTYGVDLNRNYGYKWGYDNTGSSPNTSSQVYRGDSAFSEPETRMVRQLTDSNNFQMALNYHSYGNLLIYPWGYVDSLTVDSMTFTQHSQHMTLENDYLYGTGSETVGYVANGVTGDWMYGSPSINKILAQTPEVGTQGFWPSSSEIVPMCKDNMWQNLTTAYLVHNYGWLRESGPRLVDTLSPRFAYQFQRLGLDSGQFEITLQPLGNSVRSVKDTFTYSSLDLLEKRADTICYQLDSCLLNGQEYRFLTTIDNGAYTMRDTVTRYYGKVQQPFRDEGDNFNQWSTGSWEITSNQYHSPGNSITDSKNGNYNNDVSETITLSSPIDLTGAQRAVLQFWARWEIEAGYDYVQLQASTDGGSSWTPVCGQYTRGGTPNQDEDAPVYDGHKQRWVQETINLHQFLGEELLLRFKLVTDFFTTEDGFYFDDMTVRTIPEEGEMLVSDTLLCRGDSVQFQTPYAGSSVQWRINQQLVDTTAGFTHLFDSAGTYAAQLMTFCNGQADTASQEIQVNKKVTTAQYTYTQSGDTFVFTSDAPNATFYHWEFGDGATSSQANPSHTYSASGSYKVCLTNGSPCDTLKQCDTITVVGRSFPGYSDLTVKPQPAHDYMIVSWGTSLNNPATLTIYNFLGQVVMQRQHLSSMNQQYRVSTSGWSEGLYYLRLRSSRATWSRKVMVSP